MLRRILADVLFARGSGLLQAGHPRRALMHLSIAARLAVANPAYFTAAARAARGAGDVDAAAAWCERALAIDYNLQDVHTLLTSLFLHGDLYSEVLGRIQRHLRPRTYVEIGVESGASLRMVQPGTQAIGIDPEPRLEFKPPANVRVFAEKSDEFFAKRDLKALFDGAPLELAFIDGMHHFEFALRDFINLERHAAPGATILLDDCFPHDRQSAQRERLHRQWTGDVWKLPLVLKKYRPDLALHIIAAPPSGVCMVRRLDPASRVLADNLQRIVAEFMPLDYAVLEKGRASKLNLFPNDWDKVRGLL